ncbi:MAG: carboxypeptidase-like regulatory domain-containing protein [Planctomycetota bacterium]
MRARDLTILCGALCLVALAGIALFAQDTHAEELTPGPGPASTPLAAPSSAATDAGPVAAAVADLAAIRGQRGGGPVDTAGWTKGMVKGDIRLAVSVLDRLGAISIIVEEARRAIDANGSFQRPVRMVVPVERGRGTPTFEVSDIPFSAYPYVVTVHAAGLNGSSRTLTIDAKTPFVDDVVLEITPGAPLSVLVRDQDGTPFTGLDVRALPVGSPADRHPHQGTTDNFGSLVFDPVLAGDYQILVHHQNQALLEPQTITVQPGMTGPHAKVQGQSLPLTIPRGEPVRLLVHDRAGYGIAGAAVTATMTDRIRLTTREAATDQGGILEFTHLQPGTWHFRVTKDRFDVWDRQVTVRAHQDALQLDVTLVPSR